MGACWVLGHVGKWPRVSESGLEVETVLSWSHHPVGFSDVPGLWPPSLCGPEDPRGQPAEPRMQSGPRTCLTTKGGGLCLPLPGGAARSQWGTLTTQVIRLAGCKILRDPKGKCTSLL